jgi:tetratricopeptide (TPR) repeat protein
MQSLAQDDPETARILFKQALEAQPENVDAMLALGGIDYAEGHYDRAAPLFERCLELRPEELECYTSLAIVRLCQNDFERARNTALAGLGQIDEKNCGPLYLILACASEGLGRHEEEVLYLKQARTAHRSVPIDSRICTAVRPGRQPLAAGQAGFAVARAGSDQSGRGDHARSRGRPAVRHPGAGHQRSSDAHGNSVFVV